MPPDLEGAEPDVIAEFVAYLISPKAHFTTGEGPSFCSHVKQSNIDLGQTFSVNGGLTCD